MGTSNADAGATGQNTINLPGGVQVLPGRQTAQTSQQGTVTSGTLYGIVLANGTTGSVFVPANMETNLPQVEALFLNKIAALSAVPVT